jgi:hypothetical protein
LEITGAFTTLDVPLTTPKTAHFMDEQCKAALDLLVQNGYLEVVKGKYRPTKTLNEVPVKETILLGEGIPFEGNWEDLYLKFIMDCNIPKQGEAVDGSLYPLNKYSEDAMKHFRDLMKRGFIYSILVMVTKTYYRTGGLRCKKNITNYITEGHWRLDYESLRGKSTEQQQQTLQKQVDESKPFTRDRIG